MLASEELDPNCRSKVENLGFSEFTQDMAGDGMIPSDLVWHIILLCKPTRWSTDVFPGQRSKGKLRNKPLLYLGPTKHLHFSVLSASEDMCFLDRDYPEAHAMLHQSTRFLVFITFPSKMDTNPACLGTSILPKKSAHLRQSLHHPHHSWLQWNPTQPAPSGACRSPASGIWDVGWCTAMVFRLES